MNVYEARVVIESCAIQLRTVNKTLRSRALQEPLKTDIYDKLGHAAAALMVLEASLGAVCIAVSPNSCGRRK